MKTLSTLNLRNRRAPRFRGPVVGDVNRFHASRNAAALWDGAANFSIGFRARVEGVRSVDMPAAKIAAL